MSLTFLCCLRVLRFRYETDPVEMCIQTDAKTKRVLKSHMTHNNFGTFVWLSSCKWARGAVAVAVAVAFAVAVSVAVGCWHELLWVNAAVCLAYDTSCWCIQILCLTTWTTFTREFTARLRSNTAKQSTICAHLFLLSLFSS